MTDYDWDYDLYPVEPLNPEEARIARRVTRNVLARTDASWSWGVWVAFIVFFLFITLLLVFAPVSRYRSVHYTAPPDAAYHPYVYSPLLVALLIGGALLLCLCLSIFGGVFYVYQRPARAVPSEPKTV